MTAKTSLESRLSAVEAALSELQHQVSSSQAATQSTNWLQHITGSFKDEPAFEDVLAYGQAIRQEKTSFLEAQDEL